MSEKTSDFTDRAQELMRVVTDPAEFQRQFREMLEEEYPLKALPIFGLGEKLEMHEFLARYQSKICGGIVPQFYNTDCEIIASEPGSVTIRIVSVSGETLTAQPSDNPKSKIQNPKSPQEGE